MLDHLSSLSLPMRRGWSISVDGSSLGKLGIGWGGRNKDEKGNLFAPLYKDGRYWPL